MIVYNEPVIEFAERYLKTRFYRATAIGFKDGLEWLGAVVFDDYHTTIDGQPLSLEASVAIVHPRCVTRYNLRVLFEYPFVHAGVKRLCIRAGSHESAKRNLIERLGFTYEGTARDGWPLGGDALLYSMLPHECRYLGMVLYQQPKPSSRSQSGSNGSRPDRLECRNGGDPGRP